MKTMRLSFHPMTRRYAEQMLSWSYDPPYDIYGYIGDDPESVVEYLAEPTNQFFAVLDGGQFFGFRSFGVDGQVEGGNYSKDYLDTGGGLAPEFCGKGLGEDWLRQGLRFGSKRFETNRFRLTIAAFNLRALKVARRVGFREDQFFIKPGDKREFRVLTVNNI